MRPRPRRQPVPRRSAHFHRIRPAAVGFCLLALLPLPDTAANGTEVNRTIPLRAHPTAIQPHTFDSQPAAVRLADGAIQVVWSAYHGGEEAIRGRVVRDEAREVIEEISSSRGVQGHPLALARGADDLDVFWVAHEAGHARIARRTRTGDDWGGQAWISPSGADALHPSASSLGRDTAVAWQEAAAGRFRIQLAVTEDGRWSEPRPLTTGETPAFRPALVRDAGGNLWAFWDEYRDGRYGIAGRRLLPEPGETVRFGSPGADAFRATPFASEREGLLLAWVESIDVRHASGVLEQRYSLHAANLRDGTWRPVTDPAGHAEAVELNHGLLTRMAPAYAATGGYLGRRLYPMFVDDEAGAWLLWERKSDHFGRTPKVPGELAGRPIAGGRYGDAFILHRGAVDYHVVAPARAAAGVFSAVASRLPRERRRIYRAFDIDLRERSPLALEKWTGWDPVELPLPGLRRERGSVTLEGKRLHLYWIDSHVHSGLTSDAEGEPDVLLHYARDRALLDAVVLQENDEVYDVPLTESEYAEGRTLTRTFHAPGRFVALHGYEWTQILPSDPRANKAEPLFWRDSFRNHRTVIYPPAGGPLLRYTEAGNDITRLYEIVARHGGVVHSQHETFALSHHPVEVGVEVASGWSLFFRNPARIHQALDAGFRIGFLATGDVHRRNPGLNGGVTGIFARELTAEALLDAYRQRRFFATTGSRILIDARLNGRFMGGEVRGPGPARLTLRAEAPRPIIRATLVRNGTELRAFSGEAKDHLEVEFTDSTPDRRENWYYWRVEIKGDTPHFQGNVAVAEGHLAWSSPLWFLRE